MPISGTQPPGTRLPSFELPTRDHSGSDSYRLRDGRVEFRPAGGHWRRLTDLDVKLHFTLDTPVGRWLATLTSVAALTRELAD